MKNKEKIYDEEISPLMNQIIEICKREGMPMFATVQYSNKNFATTCIPTQDNHIIIPCLHTLFKCVEGTGINIDAFVIMIGRAYPNKSSSVMSMLGHKVE